MESMSTYKVLLFLIIFIIPIYLISWEIDSYNAEIILRKDGTVNVKEIIDVNFKSELHHGIYRNIPVAYKNKGMNFNLRVKNINIEDMDGNSIPFKKGRKGRYLNLRIGRASKLISGKHIYVISYNVERVYMFVDENVIFYWNIIGTEWYVPILTSHSTIYFPQGVDEKDIVYNVTGGYYGSSNKISEDSLYSGRLVIQTERALQPSEGLTIYLKLPNDSVIKPSIIKEIYWFILDNWVLFVPIIVFLIMFVLWFKYGRNPEFNQYSVVVRYKPPDDLKAAEVGTLIDEMCDAQDVNSILIDLARRGYIKIIEIETKKLLFMKNLDYRLKLLKDYKTDNLEPYEKIFLDALFSDGEQESVLISSLKNKFYIDYKKIKNSIYKSLMKKKMFITNPETIRNKYMAIGMIFILAPIFLIGIIISVLQINLYFILALIISGIIIIAFGRIMPRKTRYGALKTMAILGFKEYLERVEREEIESRLKKNPYLFDEILPYALSLGVADVVASKFIDLISQPPKWFVSSNTGVFTTVIFMNSLGNAMHSFNTTLTSKPSSSGSGGSSGGGGGFSGGGFGGGGGGSW